MTSWTSMLVLTLTLLCSAGTPGLCCDWLQHYGHLSNVSLTLVQTMGNQLTDEESPVSFPYRLYERIMNDKEDNQLVFIRDSLELMAKLYRHDNRSSVTWDANKMERFLMIIHRQIHGLNLCVSTQITRNTRLRRYYRRLEKKTLYSTGGSPASWELIRKESKLHLDQLNQLWGFMVESASASRGRSKANRPQH
ncbi:interferon phi 1 [Gasterosteus aculeatus]|uniref:interferon phi 1 n=1 Tax=Gasterosteus aculeatus aculeatus TaxID=481459 RepID=UPI001A980A6A|nr:interferon phi 1 [Gasterosteus aculeatus aculeatus]